MKLLNEKQIIADWSPMVEEKTGITDATKTAWIAKYAHFHALNEGFDFPAASQGNVPGMGNAATGAMAGGAGVFHTGATGSGDKFPSLLPISLQVAARTIGFDIVPVIPMNGPTGVLTYLDYVYAGGREPGKAAANGPAGGEDALLIEFDSTGLTAAEAKEITLLTVGAEVDTSGKETLQVKFVGKSRISGNHIFAIVKGSVLSVADIVSVDAKVYGNATATPTATTDLGTFKSKAQMVKTPENHIQGYTGAGLNDTDDWYGNNVDGTKNPEPMRRGVGETSYFRPIGLETFTKFVEAGTYQASAVVTTEQIQDLNRQYGIDVVGMVENQLINEISKSINFHILSRAFALGWDNHVNFQKVEGQNLNMSFTGSTVASPAFINKEGTGVSLNAPAVAPVVTGATFENQATLQRRVMSIILAGGNVVSQRGRRGPANFIVTNLQMATVLQDNAQYQFAPMANTVNQNNGSLYPVGTVAGMTVYVDPNMGWSDTRVLIGRKGADEEPGLKFMPYMMAESISTIAEGTMSPKIAVKSRYALVEAGFHPETQYITLYVATGNKLIGAGA